MIVNDKNLTINFTDDNWIEINSSSFDFFGRYSKSENGRYTLAWIDQSDDETMGRYLLLDDQKIVVDGCLQRPNDGKVANNGAFIINDWLLGNQSELKSNFLAYNKEGDLVISRQFSANLVSNGISNNGRFAICQAAYSDTVDGNTITCFDLAAGQQLWQKIPETRWADSFEFDDKENVIHFISEMGKFKYTLSGEFLDDKKWYQARLEQGSAFDIIEIADTENIIINSHSNSNEIKKLLALYLLAIERGIAPYYRAKLHRKVGEIYELLGENDQAVIHYEKALTYNPNIGVKKKLRVLRTDTRTEEKRYPFSIKTCANNLVSFDGTEKGVKAGCPPRGVYFQIDHYKNACWYIKNHYKSGLEKGKSTISIITSRGDLLRTVELDHLVYQIKRASKSDYFAAISYDLSLYLYSPEFKLIAHRKLSKNVADRYELKQVDVSPSGNLVVIINNGEPAWHDRKLQEIKLFTATLSANNQGYPEKDLIDNGLDDVSVAQIFDDNDIYFGTYSGMVKRWVKDDVYEVICKCDDVIRHIQKQPPYLFVVCDRFIEIFKDGKKTNSVQRLEGFGRLIWDDFTGLEITKRFVKIFTFTGATLAEIEFTENIADCYLSGDRLRVFTASKAYIFSISQVNL